MIVGMLDDDREFARSAAENIPVECLVSGEPEEVFQWVEEDRIDGLFTDLYLDGTTGIEVVERIREINPDLPVVVMTGYGSVDTAVDAMKKGAWDYLEKPLNMERVRVLCDRMEDELQQRQAIEAYRRDQTVEGGLVGSSSIIQSIRKKIDRFAGEPVNVLIEGETGTGKEIIARQLHGQSSRSDAPFVTVNCAALPGSMVETELFGHVKGAFPGADRTRKGFIELADKGTLLLDDLDEMEPSLQSKLLRVVSEGEVTKLGTEHPRNVDVRFLATTAAQPEKKVEQEQLRSELYYRLNVARIEAPPLRTHPEDIPELIKHFRSTLDIRIKEFSPDALETLQAYTWPGNVRELRNVVERATIATDSDTVRVSDLPSELTNESGTPFEGTSFPWKPYGDSLNEALQAIERQIIEAALEATDGNQAKAARRLGLSRQALHYKLSREEKDA